MWSRIHTHTVSVAYASSVCLYKQDLGGWWCKNSKKPPQKTCIYLGRSPGEGKGYPLQYSGLESSMDCTVYGVAKSRTRLSDFHFQCLVYNRPLRQFTHTDSLNPHSNPEADTISIPLYRGVNWGMGGWDFFLRSHSPVSGELWLCTQTLAPLPVTTDRLPLFSGTCFFFAKVVSLPPSPKFWPGYWIQIE